MITLGSNQQYSKHLLAFLVFFNFMTVILPQHVNTSVPDVHIKSTSCPRNISHELTIGFKVNVYIITAMSAFGIILNGVLLVVFAVDPLHCLHNISSRLIINLSIADSLSATMILLWSGHIWGYPQLSDTLANVIFSAIWLGYTVSFLTIALLSCERFIAIKYTWSVHTIVTKQRTMYAIAIVWLLSCSAFINLDDEYQIPYMISLSIFFIFSNSVAVWFYYRLWHIRYTQALKHIDTAFKRDHEMRLTVVVFVLVVILLITSLPLLMLYQIIYFISKFCGEECLGETIRSLPIQLFPIFILNFILNPFIYGWRLPKYRRSFYLVCYRVFLCSFPKPRQNITVSNSNIKPERTSSVTLTKFNSTSFTSIQAP